MDRLSAGRDRGGAPVRAVTSPRRRASGEGTGHPAGAIPAGLYRSASRFCVAGPRKLLEAEEVLSLAWTGYMAGDRRLP